MQTLAAVTLFTDAMSIVSALTPLIQQQLTAGGRPITDDDVRAALAGKDAALARFDLLIAQRLAAERQQANLTPSELRRQGAQNPDAAA